MDTKFSYQQYIVLKIHFATVSFSSVRIEKSHEDIY